MTNKKSVRIEKSKRVVVKVGSNVLTQNSGLNIDAINSLSSQISELIDNGREVIIVSSGAMAAGIKKIGLEKRPTEIPQRQAAAAIGQAGLILEYDKAFAKFDKKVAQILLTADDLSNRRRYLNARNTLNTLLSWNIIPVINENDSVVVEEIKFGDNDNLSAMITLLLDADFLLNLTDIDGLFTSDPRIDKSATLIPEISTIGKNIEKYASDIPGALGTGGMLSKIKAAKKTTTAGIPMIIARGTRKNIISDIFSGENLGTYFIPKREKLANKKRWIAYNLKPKGSLFLDKGAEKAIVTNGKSILAIGITKISGDFGVGAPVKFCSENGKKLGVGLVNYSSKDILSILGLSSKEIESKLGHKTYDEVIHRDNLTVTKVEPEN